VHRRAYLDWLRGVAVLIMIEAHLFDSWTRVSERANPVFGNLMVLAGYGAPIFLFLAGIALALAAGSRQRKGLDDVAVAALARKRAWQIFGLAFLFRLQAMVISGGSLLSIFKVDILNVMGLSMLGAALLWGWGRSRATRIIWLAGATVACTMVTPLVRQLALLAPLHDRLEGYFRPAGGLNTFSLFPWAGFVFAGAAIGVWLDTTRDQREERNAVLAIGALGVVIGTGGYLASFLPPIYPQTNFWTSSPTFFFLRIGVLMAAVSVAYGWLRVWRWYSPIADFGRSSLFVYWIHIEMVYGLMSRPLHKQLTFGEAAAAYAMFTIFLFLIAKAKDRLLPSLPPVTHWPALAWRRGTS
jgi:uncharacterized membrane protein